MTAHLYLECFVAGLMGVIFHLIIKVNALRKRAITANETFSFTMYIQKDWLSVFISVFTVAIVVYAVDEILDYKPVVMKWLKWFFIAVGYMGSSVLQSLLSKTERQVMEVINRKTDVADRAINESLVSGQQVTEVQKAQEQLIKN